MVSIQDVENTIHSVSLVIRRSFINKLIVKLVYIFYFIKDRR